MCRRRARLAAVTCWQHVQSTAKLSVNWVAGQGGQRATVCVCSSGAEGTRARRTSQRRVVRRAIVDSRLGPQTSCRKPGFASRVRWVARPYGAWLAESCDKSFLRFLKPARLDTILPRRLPRETTSLHESEKNRHRFFVVRWCTQPPCTLSTRRLRTGRVPDG